MARARHCDVCKGWHDLEEPWPSACMDHYRKRKGEDRIGLQIVKDIDPYKSVVDGSVIGGRKQHRDHLRARGLVEVGNDNVKQQYQPPPNPVHDIVRAMEEHRYKE